LRTSSKAVRKIKKNKTKNFWRQHPAAAGNRGHSLLSEFNALQNLKQKKGNALQRKII
jgi:hypothetical protein